MGTRIAAAVAAGVLVGGIVVDVHGQMRLHGSQGQLAATRSQVQRTAARAAATTRSTHRIDGQTALLQGRLTEVSAELATAVTLMAQSHAGVARSGVAVGAVHACAGGVQRSVSALAAGYQGQAVADLSAVSSVCESLLASQSGGPVYPFDFADPDIITVKGGYDAYGTNSAAGNIQMMTSTDLVHWKKAGNALPTLPRWARSGSTWAPAVIHLGRSYLLYYTAATASTGTQCLSVATARRAQGPFVDTSRAPLECQTALGGSIDPSAYVDPSGTPYLVWKSNGGPGQPATLWAQALDPRGTALRGAGPTALLQPGQPWEGSVVEAPSMVTSGGGVLLFYSGNNWDSTGYAIGVARCRGPLGPCVRPLARPLLGSQPNLEGPGGESVFTDAQGHLEMAFHAWLPGGVGYPHNRFLFIRPLTVSGTTVQVG
ncbi:MAG TPA: glycoside hydrolase family 43 protein [Acidimicrobiales bacterium]